MAKLSISVLGDSGDVKCHAQGEEDIVWMVYQEEYEPGDQILFSTDEFPAFYVIRVDSCLDEAYVYMTQAQAVYTIPFDQENPFKLPRISYPYGSFIGKQHYLTIRQAGSEENENYRNLAKNVMDQKDSTGCYPHVHANAETKGPVAALFAARNVIDGIVANTCHYPWPFQSWGIDQRADAEITVEFGRPVDMEELRLTTRADFPHDSWWTEATVSFSDGGSETLQMEKSVQPHRFSIRRNGITWLKLSQLIQADDPSPYPALTQIEVFGYNSRR